MLEFVLLVCCHWPSVKDTRLSSLRAFAQIICGRCLFLLNKWRAEKVSTSGLIATGCMRSAEYCMPYRCRAEIRVKSSFLLYYPPHLPLAAGKQRLSVCMLIEHENRVRLGLVSAALRQPGSQLTKAINLFNTHYSRSLLSVTSTNFKHHQLSALWLFLVVFNMTILPTFWLLQWTWHASGVLRDFICEYFCSEAGMGVDVPWALLISGLKCVAGLIRVWMLEICRARLS